MIKENLLIQGIPAIVWGEKSPSVYIYVHGQMSQKEEADMFAQKATQRGYQVISFDLPEHGDRKNQTYSCDVWNGVHDLTEIYNYVQKRWNNISLYGSSLGAYFSLLSYKDFPIMKCLFLSPILNMEKYIQNMMKRFDVTEESLREKQTIPTPKGETLSWKYYTYVKEHPIVSWNIPTSILWGSKDNLTKRETVDDFVRNFNCELTVLEDSEHWFHTEEQLYFLDKWLDKHI